MLNIIDNFLNKITMYRLVLYFLIFLLLLATGFSAMGMLPFSPLMLLFGTALLLIIGWAVNFIFSEVFNAPTNVESFYITALILALIITPPQSFSDVSYLMFIFWAALWAMASKYILAIGKKHIFNPAAFAVALTALTLGQSASWWVGTGSMLPFVFVGGFLITRKIRRTDLVLSFIFISLLVSIFMHAHSFGDIFKFGSRAIKDSPLFFFAFVMLTEPLTTPPTKYLRIGYGALVGAIFDPMVHLGSMYSTPELALIVGNVFSYLVSPKLKLMLRFKSKTQIAKDTYDFSFASSKDEIPFRPGQYFEWTLPHEHPDSRGNRRYFTIASSPISEEVHIGVKFYPKSSSFKNALLKMERGDKIVASQLAGDFIMPRNKRIKLCFIAGGIGVTPFESMINYMLKRGQKRNVVMFYSNRTVDDIAYMETFEKARTELGIKTIYALSELDSIPSDWKGARGFITAEMIAKEVPDFEDRIFYISGPHSMVSAFNESLSRMGVNQSQIITDFFPGFA
ncbi:MAG: oxidoreductase [Patescibacteria group bacterium]|nr:oxidoreductase [Patescibacteria group bacterium]